LPAIAFWEDNSDANCFARKKAARKNFPEGHSGLAPDEQGMEDILSPKESARSTRERAL